MAAQTGEKVLKSPIFMVTLLVAAQVLALSVWFSASAIVPALAAQYGLPLAALSSLSAATQLGFVAGAVVLAFVGLADHARAPFIFAFFALIAGGANLVLPYVEPIGSAAHVSRFIVGAALAGVYPVGLKLAVSWSEKRRGFLASLLVGALTLGSALPYLIKAELLPFDVTPQTLIMATSLCALLGAVLMLPVQAGPFSTARQHIQVRATMDALKIPGVRSAYLGYFGHMWELYAFWAWIGVAVSVAASAYGYSDPGVFGASLAFAAMALGAVACVPAGVLADKFGKLAIARAFMIASGVSGIAAALLFDVSLPLFSLAVLIWGITIIPDSAQFSALVGDHAPPGLSGSLLTLQTAIGFGLTVITVHGTPLFASTFGWPATFMVLAAGPLFGAWLLGRKRSPR